MNELGVSVKNCLNLKLFDKLYPEMYKQLPADTIQKLYKDLWTPLTIYLGAVHGYISNGRLAPFS